MRSALPLGAALALVVLGAAASGGCTGGSTLDSGDGGVEGGGPDRASGDSSSTDASSGDGSTWDGSSGCNYVDGMKRCNTVADCTLIAHACYCGAQPVIGIAKASESSAQVCESQARSHCALGCASFPGQVAEDGANNEDGGTITVLCDSGKCHTVLR
jgi:hypothetical protein